MFRDEAYLAATLKHPNIVRVFDIGRHGEDYFFTMEYVHGENLRTILQALQKSGGMMPLQHVLTIALGVSSALHYAHEQVDHEGNPLKIVHRDVSPTNVLVATDGSVKIVDFGIAKAAAATHVTQAGMLKGKASYMSPEQCRAEAVDRRSDVFAIGILVYEMTTLTRLFRGDNELAILHQVLSANIEPPSERRTDYPVALERIVLKALRTEPRARYATALDLQRDLEAYAEAEGVVPSHAALAGYLHDLFGPKPMPWVDAVATEHIGDDASVELETSAHSFEAVDETDLTRNRVTTTPPPRPSPSAASSRPTITEIRAPPEEPPSRSEPVETQNEPAASDSAVVQPRARVETGSYPPVGLSPSPVPRRPRRSSSSPIKPYNPPPPDYDDDDVDEGAETTIAIPKNPLASQSGPLPLPPQVERSGTEVAQADYHAGWPYVPQPRDPLTQTQPAPARAPSEPQAASFGRTVVMDSARDASEPSKVDRTVVANASDYAAPDYPRSYELSIPSGPTGWADRNSGDTRPLPTLEDPEIVQERATRWLFMLAIVLAAGLLAGAATWALWPHSGGRSSETAPNANTKAPVTSPDPTPVNGQRSSVHPGASVAVEGSKQPAAATMGISDPSRVVGEGESTGTEHDEPDAAPGDTQVRDREHGDADVTPTAPEAPTSAPKRRRRSKPRHDAPSTAPLPGFRPGSIPP
jgi:serine/threonine protein kinase